MRDLHENQENLGKMVVKRKKQRVHSMNKEKLRIQNALGKKKLKRNGFKTMRQSNEKRKKTRGEED